MWNSCASVLLSCKTEQKPTLEMKCCSSVISCTKLLAHSILLRKKNRDVAGLYQKLKDVVYE
ncbi:UNVERIFIED_CONTAM: hypothetical protein FKN15_008798 [Acipenser sinensis]